MPGATSPVVPAGQAGCTRISGYLAKSRPGLRDRVHPQRAPAPHLRGRRFEGITPCWRGPRLSLALAQLSSGVQDLPHMQFAVVATAA
jgi:hypothetical protein